MPTLRNFKKQRRMMREKKRNKNKMHQINVEKEKYDKYIGENEMVAEIDEGIYKSVQNEPGPNNETTEVIYIIKEIDLKKENYVYGGFRELVVLKFLDHPNIIKLIDHFIYNKKLYMVLPFIPHNLYDVIRDENKKLSPDQISKIMFGVLSAIKYMHNNNVAHRDLKPDNIMLMDDYTPIVIDFGQARTLSMKNSTRISTCYYRAPEVAGFYEEEFTGLYNEKIDMWALGCILFEMHTTHKLVQLPESSDEESDYSEDGEEDSDKDSEEYSDEDREEYSDEENKNVDDDKDDITNNNDTTYKLNVNDLISSEDRYDHKHMDSESDDDNEDVVRDIFRKLGTPSKHVLDKYNLKQFVSRPYELVHMKKMLLEEYETTICDNTHTLLHGLLDYDPAKRFTPVRCLQNELFTGMSCDRSNYIHPKLDSNIDFDQTKNPISRFEKYYKQVRNLMKGCQGDDEYWEGIELQPKTYIKAKKLALRFIGKYGRKFPERDMKALFSVCIYICDKLIDYGECDQSDYFEVLNIKEVAFYDMLKQVLQLCGDVIFQC